MSLRALAIFAAGFLIVPAITALVGGTHARLLVGIEIIGGSLVFVVGEAYTSATTAEAFSSVFYMGVLTSIAGWLLGDWTWKTTPRKRPEKLLEWWDLGFDLAIPYIRWVGLMFFVFGGLGTLLARIYSV